LPVVKLAVWQKAHPTALNTFLPLAIDGAPPGVSGDGAGGASRRLKNANFSMALSASVVAAARRRVRSRTHLRHRDVIVGIQSSRRDKRTGNAIASLAAIGRFRLVVGAQRWGNARSVRKRRACFTCDRKNA
jgi:hypothetical protein